MSIIASEGKSSFSLGILRSTGGAPPPGTTGTFQSGTGLILIAESKFADGRTVWLGSQIDPDASFPFLPVAA